MRTCTSFLLYSLPVLAGSQTPQSILDKVREQRLERLQGVGSCLPTRTTAGSRSPTLYRRNEVETDDGPMTVFLPRGLLTGMGGEQRDSVDPGSWPAVSARE